MRGGTFHLISARQTPRRHQRHVPPTGLIVKTKQPPSSRYAADGELAPCWSPNRLRCLSRDLETLLEEHTTVGGPDMGEGTGASLSENSC